MVGGNGSVGLDLRLHSWVLLIFLPLLSDCKCNEIICPHSLPPYILAMMDYVPLNIKQSNLPRQADSWRVFYHSKENSN